MGTKRESVQSRLNNMRKIYLKLSEILDNIPEAIPESVRTLIKDKILGDKDLKELMDGIDQHRPPRFLLVGRTGVGKSSLINTLTGCYLAQVSDTQSCTPGIEVYQCKDQGQTLMEILDTRGIAESDQLNERKSAEDQLLEQVNKFSPDAAIFLLNCAHRDSVGDDVDYLREVVKQYESVNRVHLPIIVVVTRADEVAPSRFKKPGEYPDRKKDSIDEIVRNYREVIDKHGLKIGGMLPISSLIDWQTEDGEEVSVESINNMTPDEISQLTIAFDGRYNIDVLRDLLESVIEDFQAKMGLRMAIRLDELVKRLGNHLTNIFAGISAIVAVSPIPVSDIYILLIIQATLVTMIAALSGRDISLDTAREFVFSMAKVGGLGYVFRLTAQQASKLINLLFPAAGSFVSSAIASGGTKMIGSAAIAHYIDGKTIEEAKKLIKGSHENE